MEQLPQLIVHGIITGSIYTLISLGIALIFGVLNFLNLAHGSLGILGAYFFYYLHFEMSYNLIPSICGALILISIIIYLIEKLVFKSLRESPELITLLASAGIGLMVDGLIMLLFGSQQKNFRTGAETSITYDLLGTEIVFTKIHIIIFLTSIILTALLFIFLNRTKTGQAIRAVSDNKEMASILGINVNRVISIIFVLSTILATIGGLLFSYNLNLAPTHGNFLTIVAFAVVLMGGSNNLKGTIAAAFILGFAEEILAGIHIGFFSIPSGFKTGIVFVVLILLLYLRPNGLFTPKHISDTRSK